LTAVDESADNFAFRTPSRGVQVRPLAFSPRDASRRNRLDAVECDLDVVTDLDPISPFVLELRSRITART